MIKFEQLIGREKAVAIVGLGYVGLPLAVALGSKLRVIGLDVDHHRLERLQAGVDPSGSVTSDELEAAQLELTADPSRLADAGVIIVAVPTPIDEHKRPDLRAMESASRSIGESLTRGTVVVYESTVYPGVTEEVCGPILAARSGLEPGQGFYLGYSPERINPGDREHTLANIKKVVAAQDPEALELLKQLYGLVVHAGVHPTPDIRTAELAKVLENTQRDINIALMNEVSVFCSLLGIDTRQVLEAAGTKWNFLRFHPGLVGGHCIGVDPYYLTHKAQELGQHPQVILAGRRINDGMPRWVAENVVKKLIGCGKVVRGSRVLVAGVSFKADVPDIRNSKVLELIRELESYRIDVEIHDPVIDPGEAQREIGLTSRPLDKIADLDGLVLAVAHSEVPTDVATLRAMFKDDERGVLIDIPMLLDRREVEAAGLDYWSL